MTLYVKLDVILFIDDLIFLRKEGVRYFWLQTVIARTSIRSPMKIALLSLFQPLETNLNCKHQNKTFWN